MRRSCAISIATIMVATLLLSACQSLEAEQTESEPLDLLSVLNAAVLDWCDAQLGADFYLPHISAPSCDTGETLYLGTLKGIFGDSDAPDAAWWWELRAGYYTDVMIGVLWYVGPNDPEELCVASRGLLCQCPTALEALNNPARVPVVLIGPGASVCESGPRSEDSTT